MKIALTAIDAIFLARPVLWIPVWGFCALGYCRALTADYGVLQHGAGRGQFVWMFVFSMAVGSVYVLNQIADFHVDSLNKGFPLLVRGRIGLKTAYVSALFFAAASIIGAALLRPSFAFFSAAALALGIIYSFKPAYLSGRPITDFCANALGYGGIAFGAGWTLAGRTVVHPSFITASAPYVLLMAGGSICSTLPDYDGDKALGKKTTAVVFGKTRALALATVLIIAACGAALLSGDTAALVSGGAALVVLIAYRISPNETLMEATYKVGGAFMMLVASAMFPVIIIPSLTVLLATLLYFRLRHGVSYPSLIPVSHDS